MLGRSDKRFQYRIKIPKAETLFLATEARFENQPNPFSCSRLIHEDFTLNIMDQRGMPEFLMKINTKWTYSLNKLHVSSAVTLKITFPCETLSTASLTPQNITVGNANLVGTVEENFGIIGANFTVYDETRKKLCNIIGPNVCGCCMYKEAQFQVIYISVYVYTYVVPNPNEN